MVEGAPDDFVTSRASQRSPVLVLTAGGLACAIPLHHVVETMRPLPVEPVAGTPVFVRGISVIRGQPTPVVDLGALLQADGNTTTFTRFVTLKLGQRRVALGVAGVVGSRNLDSSQLEALPPLLRDVAADVLEAVSARDAELLVVLRAGRLVSDEVWATLAAAGATR